MMVNEQIAIEHGLKSEEYKKFVSYLKELQILLNLEFFQQCGMSIVPINHQEYI